MYSYSQEQHINNMLGMADPPTTYHMESTPEVVVCWEILLAKFKCNISKEIPFVLLFSLLKVVLFTDRLNGFQGQKESNQMSLRAHCH